MRKLRMEIEMALVGRGDDPSRSRAAALQVAGLLLVAEGVAERDALDVDPIEGRRTPLALV